MIYEALRSTKPPSETLRIKMAQLRDRAIKIHSLLKVYPLQCIYTLQHINLMH